MVGERALFPIFSMPIPGQPQLFEMYYWKTNDSLCKQTKKFALGGFTPSKWVVLHNFFLDNELV
jgi:hypothetical protein